jgi:hypothetical protein
VPAARDVAQYARAEVGLARQAVYMDSDRHSRLVLPVQEGDMLVIGDWTFIVTGVTGATGRVVTCFRDDGEMIHMGRSLFYDDPYDQRVHNSSAFD